MAYECVSSGYEQHRIIAISACLSKHQELMVLQFFSFAGIPSECEAQLNELILSLELTPESYGADPCPGCSKMETACLFFTDMRTIWLRHVYHILASIIESFYQPCHCFIRQRSFPTSLSKTFMTLSCCMTPGTFNIYPAPLFPY